MPPDFLGPETAESERLSALVEVVLKGQISNRELRRALPRVWDGVDVPCLQEPQVVIFALFKRTGFLSNRTDVTGPPSDDVPVWRGAHPDRAKGLCWFTSRDNAAWFADPENARRQLEQARLQGIVRVHEAVGDPQPPRLYRAVAPTKAILALFGDEGDREVIVDPNELRDVTAVDDCVTE